MNYKQTRRELRTIIVAGCAFAIILFFFHTQPLAAQVDDWLLLSQQQDEYPLGLHLAYLEDVDKVWTIDDVSQGELNGRFQRNPTPGLNFGFTASAYWLRLNLRNNNPHQSQWRLQIANPLLNQVDIYLPQGDDFAYKQAGTLIPFNSQQVFHHHLVFALNLPPGSEQTIYLRVEDDVALIVPATLWSLEAFNRYNQTQQFSLGFIYGIFIIIVAYNLFIFFSLRDASYFYFVLFLCTYILGQAANDGLAKQYLWPQATDWADFASLFFSAPTGIAALQFANHFLSTAIHAPRWHGLTRVVIGLWFLLWLIAPFALPTARTIMVLLMLLLSIAVVFVMGLKVWRQRYKPARFFVLAWLGPFVGVIVFSFGRLGLIPASVFTEQGTQFGSIWLILLLSLSLADRINSLQQEKGEALAQVKRTNKVLEQRVAAQTAELAQANTSLSEQSSKLESLRQLGLEVTSELDLTMLLQAIVSRAAELVGTNRGGLFLWRDDKQVLELVAAIGDSPVVIGTLIQAGQGLTGQVWLTGQAVAIADYIGWENRVDEFAKQRPQTAIVCVPVRWRDEAQGVLTILDESGRQFAEEDVELLRLFAAQTAVALQNARLINQAQQYTQQLEAEIFERRQAEDGLQHYRGHLEDLVEQRTVELKKANQQLEQEIQERMQAEKELRQRNRILLALQSANLIVSSSLDLQEVLNIVAHEMASLFGISTCDILTWNPDTNIMVMVAGYRHPRHLDASEMESFDLNEYPLTERVLRQKVVAQMTINQPDIDPDEYRYMTNEGSKTLLMIPIIFHNEAIGLVTLEDYVEERIFMEEEISLAQLLTHQAANAIQNARSYRQARQLITELENKNAELERFTYTVSHDLKSPLVTVQGFLGYLEKDALNGDMVRLRSDIEHIRAASHRMKMLLDDLLELSRIGRVMNKLQWVAFNLLAEEAVQLIGGYIQKKKVEIIIAPDMPAVYGDRSRLVEVLQNLLDNAVKFMGDQPEPRIEVGYEERQTEPIFFVRDNGIGIEPRHQETIFGLFDRLDQSVEGTGIGLALVRRIVEVHNGRVWIESLGKGQGSTFYFTLPIENST